PGGSHSSVPFTMQSPQRGAPGFSRSSWVVPNPGLQKEMAVSKLAVRCELPGPVGDVPVISHPCSQPRSWPGQPRQQRPVWLTISPENELPETFTSKTAAQLPKSKPVRFVPHQSSVHTWKRRPPPGNVLTDMAPQPCALPPVLVNVKGPAQRPSK